MNNPGELLAQLRKEAGLSQSDLAEMTNGSSRSMISKVEIGERKLSRGLINEYSLILGLDKVTKGRLLLAFGYAPWGLEEMLDRLDAFHRAYTSDDPRQNWRMKMRSLVTFYGEWAE